MIDSKDKQLNNFWKDNVSLVNIIKSIADKDKDWPLAGSQDLANRYANILHKTSKQK